MNLPTKLTLARIIFIPVFIVFFFLPFDYMRFIATGIFVLLSLTDMLDGYIARKYNLITDLGKFLDPIADKMLVACALIAVIVDAHILQIGVAVCAMIILCRELFISGFRIVASGKGLVLAADKLGKIKTILQMIALILLLPYSNINSINGTVGDIILYIGCSFLLLATIMTIVSGVNYLLKNKQVLKG